METSCAVDEAASATVHDGCRSTTVRMRERMFASRTSCSRIGRKERSLIALGIGQIVTPLILGYVIAFSYVVLGIREGRAPMPALVTLPESSDERLSSPDADDDDLTL
jgi:hypothetical protein